MPPSIDLTKAPSGDSTVSPMIQVDFVESSDEEENKGEPEEEKPKTAVNLLGGYFKKMLAPVNSMAH